jgi:hypothetical protein
VIRVRRALENRKIKVAQAATDYIAQNGQLDSGFYGVLNAIGQESLDGSVGAYAPPAPQEPAFDPEEERLYQEWRASQPSPP